MQRFDDLVDGLFAEVGDGVELRLGLGDEIADRLDASTLEAVIGAHAELELLDQDAPLLALQRSLGVAANGKTVAVELSAGGGVTPLALQGEEWGILIEELELGVRSYNCLKRAGIQTVGDLISKSEAELNAIPNFGKKSIDEVIETLHARGLALRND